MPPKRKAPQVAETNASKPPSAKKTKAGDAAPTNALFKQILERRSDRWSPVSGTKNLDAEMYETLEKDPDHAFTFQCVCDPLRNQEDEGEDDDDDDDESDEGDSAGRGNDKDTTKKQPCDGGKSCPCGKPFASLPNHPYTFTRAGMGRHNVAGDMMSLRNPDSMGMYTFNDHTAYGALEVVQNMMLDFDEAYNGKRWLEAWSVLEGLGLFMLKGDGNMMCMADDSSRIEETAVQIARMSLALLAALEEAKILTTEGSSTIPNVGLVIAILLQVIESLREQGLLEDVKPTKAKTFKFNASNVDIYLRAIARKCNITIPKVDDMAEDEIITLPGSGSKDPWGWTKSFTAYSKSTPGVGYRGAQRTTIGGDYLDISSWSSAERKKASFDKKDPLPRDIVKKLKEGLILTPG